MKINLELERKVKHPFRLAGEFEGNVDSLEHRLFSSTWKKRYFVLIFQCDSSVCLCSLKNSKIKKTLNLSSSSILEVTKARGRTAIRVESWYFYPELESSVSEWMCRIHRAILYLRTKTPNVFSSMMNDLDRMLISHPNHKKMDTYFDFLKKLYSML